MDGSAKKILDNLSVHLQKLLDLPENLKSSKVHYAEEAVFQISEVIFKDGYSNDALTGYISEGRNRHVDPMFVYSLLPKLLADIQELLDTVDRQNNIDSLGMTRQEKLQSARTFLGKSSAYFSKHAWENVHTILGSLVGRREIEKHLDNYFEDTHLIGTTIGAERSLELLWQFGVKLVTYLEGVPVPELHSQKIEDSFLSDTLKELQVIFRLASTGKATSATLVEAMLKKLIGHENKVTWSKDSEKVCDRIVETESMQLWELLSGAHFLMQDVEKHLENYWDITGPHDGLKKSNSFN